MFLFLTVVLFSSCSVISEKEVHDMNPRNKMVDMSVKYKSMFDHSVIVVNVSDYSTECDRIDILRCLMQCIRKLRHENYKSVELAYKGKSKYCITGEDFKGWGNDSEQGIIDMATYFSASVKNLDGTNAFVINVSDEGLYPDQVTEKVAQQVADYFKAFIDTWVEF